MRIALASALILVVSTLLQAAAFGQEQEISAKQAYANGDYATALRLWRVGAGEGDAKAQVNLGHLYALGHGVPKDEMAAISWFRKAADQGSAVAHHNLGVMYETGGARDLEAAARHFRVAAEDGRTESQTALGKLYQHGRGVPKDYREAAKWLEEAADDNDPEAQFLLGAFHANGWGVERDLNEMLHWTRRSARQGHPKALFHMGLAYDQGIGVGRDPVSAARFYAVAAKKGDTRAQSRLGAMYFHGIGVKQDHKVAFALLTKAAAAGEALAQYVLGYAHHVGRGVERNAERGVAYYRRAADQGHLDAQIKLGLAYDTGAGVPENPRKAFGLYRIGAEAGRGPAQYALGRAYRLGRGVGKDEAEAVRWFLKAARGGHGDAQLALFQMYRDGTGVGRNDQAALRWIEEAARSGSPQAMADLAELYLVGNGVARDGARALALLRKAAKGGLRSAESRLADVLAEGKHVPRDTVAAAELYRGLAENGDAHGTSMLAAFHLRGEGGIERDPKRAVELFRIAANLGSAYAAKTLAALHYEGRDVEKSQAKAAEWYKRAAAKGDYSAHYALGAMYLHGRGVAADHAAAERHYRSALEVSENSGGPFATSNALMRLAELDHHKGLNERAAGHFRRAVEILHDAEGGEQAYLESLTGLAAVYRDQGRLEAADDAISRALESLGPGAEDTASILRTGLGNVYESLARHERAAEVYDEVLAAMKARHETGPGHVYVLAARGRVSARLGRDDRSEADFTQALTLMEARKRDGFAPIHARALGDYGRLLTRLGHFGEAAATFEKAEKLIDGIGLTLLPAGLAGARDFALAYERQGKRASAIAVLRRAVRDHIGRRREIGSGNPAIRAAERALVRQIFLDYVRLLTRRRASPERVAESFEAAQRMRYPLQATVTDRIASLLPAGDAALGRLLGARRAAIAARRRIERRLVGPEAGFGRVDPRIMRRGVKELRALARRLERLDAMLRQRAPGIARLLSPTPLGIAETRRLLGAGEALVATLSGRRETHVWVLTPETLHYHRAALGARSIARMAGRLRASLDPKQNTASDDPEPFPLALSAELYRHLFAPAHGALEDVSHVFYVTDSALRSLPLSVLVADLAEPPADTGDGSTEISPGTTAEAAAATASASRFARYREVVWLIDKFAYSQIPSLKALRGLRRRAAASKLSEIQPWSGTVGELRALARGLGAAKDIFTPGPKPEESAVKSSVLMVSRWPVEPNAQSALTAGISSRRDDGGPQGLAHLLQRSVLEILNDESRPSRLVHPMYWGGFTVVGDGGRRPN